MGRAPCCDKTIVKRGPWSSEEDAKLKAYIDKYGTGSNWIALPHKIGLNRCGKSCRLRWLNYLRPNIKHGGFTEEEDNIIINLYISIGSRWSIIAAQLPERTDNDVKNYWNTRLKKKLLGKQKQQQGDLDGYTLSNSALERLQLHMQLQQNSLSFFNNPNICPKLNSPIEDSLTENTNALGVNSTQKEKCENLSPNGSTSSNEVNNNNDDTTTTTNNNNNNNNNKTMNDYGDYMGMKRVSSFQAEFDSFFGNANEVNEISDWWSKEIQI